MDLCKSVGKNKAAYDGRFGTSMKENRHQQKVVICCGGAIKWAGSRGEITAGAKKRQTHRYTAWDNKDGVVGRERKKRCEPLQMADSPSLMHGQ